MPLHLDRLDDAVLEAASSRGLLRRARADLASGAARLIRHEAEEAQIELPGAQVTLRAGGLAAARCTCPAGGICRHILTAILLLQQQAPPGAHAGESAQNQQHCETAQGGPDPVAEILAISLAELRKAFGAVRLARAAGALPAPEAVLITRAGAACLVQMQGLPEVRYVAGLGIGGMLVTASQQAARQLCAKALLAVRRAHQAALPEAAAAAATGAPQSAGIEALLERAQALLIEWARSGLAAAPEVLEERLFDAAVSARAASLFRLSSALRRLSQDVRRRRGRAIDLEPGASLRAASRCFALLEALRRDPHNAQLRGRARDRFERLDSDLRLIGCGYEIWTTPAGARGVTGHFYAPAARRWLSASLARTAGQDASFSPGQAAQRVPVWGATLERLCVSEVILKNAAVSPLGRLSLGRGTRAEIRPLEIERRHMSGWQGSFADWSVLEACVRSVFGPGLGAERLGSEVAALLPAKTGKPAFDEITQELVLPVYDRQGRRLLLRVPNQPHFEPRLLALLEILAHKPPQVFWVTLALPGERLHVRPYALLIEDGGMPWPLDAPRSLNPQDPAAQQLSGALAQLEERPPPAAAPSATQRLLAAALDALLGLCELGGRMQDPALLQKLAMLEPRLEESGLSPAAQLLGAVAGAPETQRPQALLKAAHALQGLTQLLRLPLT